MRELGRTWLVLRKNEFLFVVGWLGLRGYLSATLHRVNGEKWSSNTLDPKENTTERGERMEIWDKCSLHEVPTLLFLAGGCGGYPSI